MQGEKGAYRTKVPRFQGVYYREHETRRHNGKPDRCFDITFKADGRKMWEKVGWSSENYTAAMAAQVRADRMRTIRHGGELPKRKKRTITFGEAWGKYYTWAQASKKSPETDEFRYRGVKAELADKPLNEISPFLLEKLKSRMSKDGLSAQSVRATLTLIGGVFNKARLWGHYDGENPVKKVKLPSVNNAARVRFLSPDEARALLEEVAKVSWQFYEMCLISLHTGLRAGEVFGLRWGDVDLENGIIRVADSKAGAARVAYMTDDLKRIFKEKTPGDPRDLLFLSQRGEKIKSVSGTFDNVVNRLGLNRGVDDRRQRVVFHTLRHTFGSWLALRGVPILTIKELMGHRRIEMTMRYAHLTPDAKREAVKGLQSFFDERSNGKTANEEGTK